MKDDIVESKGNKQACFLQLPEEDQAFLEDKKRRVSYLAGETICKQGAFAPYVLYVLKGLAKIYLQTGPDKQINLRLVKAGDYMAFSSVFDETVYTYSAIALKDTDVCMIDKNALKELLVKNTDFAVRITAKNMQTENQLLEIIKNLSYKQMRGKLASTLLYIGGEEFVGEAPFQYLTRHDLADFASIATESAIKFLKEFEKEGIIKLDGKNIEILEHDKLLDISVRG